MSGSQTGATARYLRLLASEREANRRVIGSIETVPVIKHRDPNYDRARSLIPHNTIARQVWLWRIQGTPYENPTNWFPVWDKETLRAKLHEVDSAWESFLSTLKEADLAREVFYSSSEGQMYSSTVDDILIHVFNHSTYHRGQVARIVHELGGQRASTDYIALTRTAL